jgi:hypothetical protein
VSHRGGIAREGEKCRETRGTVSSIFGRVNYLGIRNNAGLPRKNRQPIWKGEKLVRKAGSKKAAFGIFGFRKASLEEKRKAGN